MTIKPEADSIAVSITKTKYIIGKKHVEDNKYDTNVEGSACKDGSNGAHDINADEPYNKIEVSG